MKKLKFVIDKYAMEFAIYFNLINILLSLSY